MRVIVELPDDLYRRAKNSAKREEKTLPDLMKEALEQRLDGLFADATGRPWLRAYAGLSHLHSETHQIRDWTEREFRSRGSL
ncbi:MAG: hypothetical protein ACFB21_06010 [Opitutales bacterium]